MAECTICLETSSVLHSHHTVPRARGGDNSLQIPLCGTCHNILHANAVSIVAQIRKNKVPKQKKNFWKNIEEEERAKPYLEILVRALLSPIPEGCERDHALSASVKTSVYETLHLLKADLGLSSVEKTLLYCIKFTLDNKGIKNVAEQKGKQKGQSEMWFMQFPPKG